MSDKSVSIITTCCICTVRECKARCNNSNNTQGGQSLVYSQLLCSQNKITANLWIHRKVSHYNYNYIYMLYILISVVLDSNDSHHILLEACKSQRNSYISVSLVLDNSANLQFSPVAAHLVSIIFLLVWNFLYQYVVKVLLPTSQCNSLKGW